MIFELNKQDYKTDHWVTKTDKLMSEAKSNRITPSCSQETSVS